MVLTNIILIAASILAIAVRYVSAEDGPENNIATLHDYILAHEGHPSFLIAAQGVDYVGRIVQREGEFLENSPSLNPLYTNGYLLLPNAVQIINGKVAFHKYNTITTSVSSYFSTTQISKDNIHVLQQLNNLFLDLLTISSTSPFAFKTLEDCIVVEEVEDHPDISILPYCGYYLNSRTSLASHITSEAIKDFIHLEIKKIYPMFDFTTLHSNHYKKDIFGNESLLLVYYINIYNTIEESLGLKREDVYNNSFLDVESITANRVQKIYGSLEELKEAGIHYFNDIAIDIYHDVPLLVDSKICYGDDNGLPWKLYALNDPNIAKLIAVLIKDRRCYYFYDLIVEFEAIGADNIPFRETLFSLAQSYKALNVQGLYLPLEPSNFIRTLAGGYLLVPFPSIVRSIDTVYDIEKQNREFSILYGITYFRERYYERAKGDCMIFWLSEFLESGQEHPENHIFLRNILPEMSPIESLFIVSLLRKNSTMSLDDIINHPVWTMTEFKELDFSKKDIRISADIDDPKICSASGYAPISPLKRAYRTISVLVYDYDHFYGLVKGFASYMDGVYLSEAIVRKMPNKLYTLEFDMAIDKEFSLKDILKLNSLGILFIPNGNKIMDGYMSLLDYKPKTNNDAYNKKIGNEICEFRNHFPGGKKSLDCYDYLEEFCVRSPPSIYGSQEQVNFLQNCIPRMLLDSSLSLSNLNSVRVFNTFYSGFNMLSKMSAQDARTLSILYGSITKRKRNNKEKRRRSLSSEVFSKSSLRNESN